MFSLSFVGLLVLTLVISQALAAFLQARRIKRIEAKSEKLCGAGGQEHLPKRVPITLITGFLGCGKTTLVNRVLSGDHGKRITVIENELGAISIDHALIDAARQKDAPAGVVVLKNGCMCCSGETPGSELERVLDQLLKMSTLAGGPLPFDYVLIETTGLADPGPIIQVLLRHEMCQSGFELDGVVTIVDAKNVLRHLRPAGPLAFARRRPEAEKQIALADRIILSKVDLVSRAELAEVAEAVLELNSTAPQLEAVRAELPLTELLDIDAFTSQSWKQREALWKGGATHGASLSCISLVAESDIAVDKLQAWLQALAHDHHEQLYRIKGVISLEGEARMFVVHGIHSQVHGTFAQEWGVSNEARRRSSLVLIGPKLDEPELRAGFLATCACGDSI